MIAQFLAGIDAPPPLSISGAVLQTLLVAALAFAALAAVLSFLRYQNLVHEARAQADVGLEPNRLILLLAEALAASSIFSVIRLAPAQGAAADLQQHLRPLLRATDLLWQTRSGEVLILLPNTEVSRVPYVTKRLKHAIQKFSTHGTFAAVGFPEDVDDTQPADPKTPRLHTATALLEHLNRKTPPTQSGWNFPDDPPPWDIRIAPGQEAFLDPETGLLPAGRTHNALAKDMAAHRRRNKPASLLLFAVDELDSYPAEQQLHVVRAAGTYLMRTCRESDLVGGLDAHEMVISMPGPLEETHAAAQRICEGSRDIDPKIRFTISCGLAAWPTHGDTPAKLLPRAGMALETARARGRASCLIFDKSMIPHPHKPSAPTSNDAEAF